MLQKYSERQIIKASQEVFGVNPDDFKDSYTGEMLDRETILNSFAQFEVEEIAKYLSK